MDITAKSEGICINVHKPPLQFFFLNHLAKNSPTVLHKTSAFIFVTGFFNVFLSKQYLQRYVSCIDPNQKESFKSMLILNCQGTEKKCNYKMLVVDGFCVSY